MVDNNIFVSYRGRNFYVPADEVVRRGAEIPQKKLDKAVAIAKFKGGATREDLRYTGYFTPAMGALSNLFGVDAWATSGKDDGPIKILAESGTFDEYEVAESMAFLDVCDVQALSDLRASDMDDLRAGKIRGAPLRTYSTVDDRSLFRKAISSVRRIGR